MKTKDARLNNIIGQIEGVKKLLNNNSDCISTLTQLKAIKSAVAGVMDTVVEEQMEQCMKSLTANDKEFLLKIKTYVKSN